MNNTIKSNSKNLQIQFLRAIFCFLIIFFHFTIQYNKYFADNNCGNVFINGFVNCFDDAGIIAFFILSGFYLIRRKELLSLKEKILYWLKRFLNLYVLYLIAIIIIFIASRFGYLGNRSVSFSVFLQNILFVNYLTHSNSVDGAHWYIFALFCLYFFAFICDLLPFDKEKYAHLFWLILLIVSICTFFVQRNLNESNSIPLLLVRAINVILCQGFYAYVFIGIAFYLLDYDKPLCIKNLFIIIGIVLCFSFAALDDWRRAIVLLIVLPVVLLAIFKKLEFLEKAKPVIFIGNASYSIYLLHQNIGFMLLNTFVSTLGYYFSLFLVIVITIAIGIGFYLLIETNIKKLFSLFFDSKRKKE